MFSFLISYTLPKGNRDLKDGSGTNVGIQAAGSAMHWGPFLPFNAYDKTHGST